MSAGKGMKPQKSYNLKKYRESPLWNNFGKKEIGVKKEKNASG